MLESRGGWGRDECAGHRGPVDGGSVGFRGADHRRAEHRDVRRHGEPVWPGHRRRSAHHRRGSERWRHLAPRHRHRPRLRSGPRPDGRDARRRRGLRGLVQRPGWCARSTHRDRRPGRQTVQRSGRHRAGLRGDLRHGRRRLGVRQPDVPALPRMRHGVVPRLRGHRRGVARQRSRAAHPEPAEPEARLVVLVGQEVPGRGHRQAGHHLWRLREHQDGRRADQGHHGRPRRIRGTVDDPHQSRRRGQLDSLRPAVEERGHHHALGRGRAGQHDPALQGHA